MVGTCGGNGPELVYTWTPSVSGHAVVSTCGTALDTVLYLRDACASTSEIACSDDACGSASSLALEVDGGKTYYLVADTRSAGTTGSLTLSVAFTPRSCVAPPTFAAAGGTRTGTTAGSGSLQPTGCSDGSAPEVVYAWKPAKSGVATFSTCGSTFDTLLYLRDGTCTGAELKCDDDRPSTVTCSETLSSWLQATVVAGHTYYIVVDGLHIDSLGAYTLNVTAPP
jgi:hypothetical protein